MTRPRVEILYFEGCPNHQPSRALVERVAADLGVEPKLELVEVADVEEAERLRFLGSPTVRVNGVDVEPGASGRDDFVLACRVYRSAHGLAGQPNERWVRDALAEGRGVSSRHLPRGVTKALTAADIPASKLGAARHARLSELERELYFWILRRFASRGRPSKRDAHRAATRLGLSVEAALATLAGEDLVHLDHEGEIAVAYPFSGRPAAHVVRFPSGHEAYAMCAIDALGIAPMFDAPIAVRSLDPLSGETIEVRLQPAGDADWSPDSAVVVAGAMQGAGESCRSCCPILNFFASSGSAMSWLAERPQVRGHVITIAEATAAGRAVFGTVLEQQ